MDVIPVNGVHIRVHIREGLSYAQLRVRVPARPPFPPFWITLASMLKFPPEVVRNDFLSPERFMSQRMRTVLQTRSRHRLILSFNRFAEIPQSSVSGVFCRTGELMLS
jgi:hypothetical protein